MPPQNDQILHLVLAYFGLNNILRFTTLSLLLRSAFRLDPPLPCTSHQSRVNSKDNWNIGRDDLPPFPAAGAPVITVGRRPQCRLKSGHRPQVTARSNRLHPLDSGRPDRPAHPVLNKAQPPLPMNIFSASDTVLRALTEQRASPDAN